MLQRLQKLRNSLLIAINNDSKIPENYSKKIILEEPEKEKQIYRFNYENTDKRFTSRPQFWQEENRHGLQLLNWVYLKALKLTALNLLIKMQRNSFIFYRSFFEATKPLDVEQKAALFDAICRYS